MSVSFNQKQELKTRYALLKERIRSLPDDSFEKNYLKPFFITKKELNERIRFEQQQRACFKTLCAKQDGSYLLKTLERSVMIDFAIVSFQKIFMKDNIKKFSDILLKQDFGHVFYQSDPNINYVSTEVQYLYADEESGEVRYLIGIYGRPDLDNFEHIFSRSYRLVDYDDEGIWRCQKGDGVIAELIEDKTLQCKIDHLEVYGYIELPDSHDTTRYLDNDDYLVLAQVDKCDRENDKIYIELSVYRYPEE